MSSENEYTPDKVWKWDAEKTQQWSKTNRPYAGATHEKELPKGEHPLQLHSLATPNGQKVTILLEELLALGIDGAEYDAYMINIGEGQQFSSGFVEINPNSKIPAMVDTTVNPPLRLFESGSILQYLAEKHDAFIPQDLKAKTECRNWLMWQMGSAPFLGGGFGHFYVYAPFKQEYPIERYTMEAKRQLDVLNKHLVENKYMAGDEYSIADMAIWPWYGKLVLGDLYGAAEFLDVGEYPYVQRWAKMIAERPAVKRGIRVNHWGENGIRERHNATDLD
ncbi:glutathione-dependent disulfide-bond oxidoreductase [Marinomonas ostreistagni]|uniref:Glutathione-dependent disulfide-bond oxidoreductase n=1 Tax=Marinomonas ostreistagni TaxID=359209 RepID=A0ABS0Z9M8_9GAMM|nr:glutathione-dependent disulfide-bond oxidoreductase [Marinomonas ostreistagni]MBJ7550355.1 glutathione-dependent disulfide-bond oxidoreductase [Marinomonas ostreistagni]